MSTAASGVWSSMLRCPTWLLTGMSAPACGSDTVRVSLIVLPARQHDAWPCLIQGTRCAPADVYERLTPLGKRPTFLTLVATQLVSGVWHGLFPGYWLFFASRWGGGLLWSGSCCAPYHHCTTHMSASACDHAVPSCLRQARRSTSMSRPGHQLCAHSRCGSPSKWCSTRSSSITQPAVSS